MSDELQEVKTLREVPRTPMHCEKPMRRMQNVSASRGVLMTVYVCEKCGFQERVPIREPVPKS